MASKRKFYRSVLEVEILSEDPVEFDNLEEVYHAITTGACSGHVEEKVVNEEVDGPTMANLLQEQGSDPGFFRLDDKGNDTEDFEEEECST